MALKLTYYGQNDSQWSPDQILTGDPGTDQQTLTAAGYLGGTVMALGTPLHNTAVPVAIIPCDTDTYNATGGPGSTPIGGGIPFGTLINGPGEFAGAIGPSGSKKAPVVRALWQGNVNSEAYDSYNTFTFVLGAYLYCGGYAEHNIGKYTNVTYKGATSPVVGICTHVPTTAEPWLGVASLL